MMAQVSAETLLRRPDLSRGRGPDVQQTAEPIGFLYVNEGTSDRDDPLAEKALEYAQRHLPVSGHSGHHYYAQLYLSQALYQQGDDEWDTCGFHGFFLRLLTHPGTPGTVRRSSSHRLGEEERARLRTAAWLVDSRF